MKAENIDWKKGNGLVPAIVQDVSTQAVLMLGFMNKKALLKTLQTKKVWFYSRTRRKLWMKGETSGHILKFMRMAVDCDQDALLIHAKPAGPTCHLGRFSCFGNEKPLETVFSDLYETILDRRKKMPGTSYTASLFRGGLAKICGKIKEESNEVIHAAKQETKTRLAEESVDLLYHLLVLLAQKNISIKKIFLETRRRRK